MAPTEITVQQLLGPFPATPLTVNTADITFTALTVTEGDTFVCTGREIVLLYNGAGTNTLTVTANPDNQGRTVDLTDYSMATTTYAMLGMGLTNAPGWKSTAGLIKLTPSSANILAAVLRLPAGYPAP
jgi:hypothetical protein